jgi:hypothetical protein
VEGAALMAKAHDELLTWDEAIALIMQRTGKNRRQATVDLVEKCRSGALPAFGERSDTGDLEKLPPSYFPRVN